MPSAIYRCQRNPLHIPRLQHDLKSNSVPKRVSLCVINKPLIQVRVLCAEPVHNVSPASDDDSDGIVITLHVTRV